MERDDTVPSAPCLAAQCSWAWCPAKHDRGLVNSALVIACYVSLYRLGGVERVAARFDFERHVDRLIAAAREYHASGTLEPAA